MSYVVHFARANQAAMAAASENQGSGSTWTVGLIHRPD